MIRNVSYNSPKIKREIDALLGKRYTWAEKWKNKQWGLANIYLLNSNGTLKTLLETQTDAPKFNLEIRPKGILIYFRRYLETYALVLKTEEINGQKPFLNFKNSDYSAQFKIKESATSNILFTIISHKS